MDRFACVEGRIAAVRRSAATRHQRHLSTVWNRSVSRRHLRLITFFTIIVVKLYEAAGLDWVCWSSPIIIMINSQLWTCDVGNLQDWTVQDCMDIDNDVLENDGHIATQQWRKENKRLNTEILKHTYSNTAASQVDWTVSDFTLLC